MKWFDSFKKKLPTFRFKSYIGNFAVATPVTTASRIKPKWVKAQTGQQKFTDCPGMLDYSHAGYLVTAPTDIHIKANSAGTIVMLAPTPIRNNDGMTPSQFNYEVVEGWREPADGIEKSAWKIPLPWSVHAEEGFSAYVLPALMHADYLDKIFVYPGIVDFDKFHTINFVFSPIKECEFTIPAGTPLLQVLPLRREVITAECGKATVEETEEHLFNIPSRAVKRYYRRFLSEKKVFKMTCPYDHRGDKWKTQNGITKLTCKPSVLCSTCNSQSTTATWVRCMT